MFEALPLGIPFMIRVVVSPVPALRVLAKLAEDEPPYAVLLTDQKQATILVVEPAARRQFVGLRSTGCHQKRSQGGWSQLLYENTP